MPWRPTEFRRFERAHGTSTGVALIVTDAGKAYMKALGNREGPHVLACEWVGTRLASLIGVPTPDCAILIVKEDDDIPLGHQRRALPGPAFVSRAMDGYNWSGGARDLRRVENPETIPRLVISDTWLRNVDRFPPVGVRRRPNYDNVFLTAEGAAPRRVRLLAIDHTHCFTWGRDLTSRLRDIDLVKDPRLYGHFPAFRLFIEGAGADVEAARSALGALSRSAVEQIMESVPEAWEVAPSVRAAWIDFVCGRADFLAENMEWLGWPEWLPGIGPV